MNKKGEVFVRLGQYDDAVKCYDKSLEIDYNNPAIWCNKGNLLYILKRYKRAIECYDKALEIDAYFAKAWYNMGNAFYCLGDYEKAIHCYDSLLTIEPTNTYGAYYRDSALKNLRKKSYASVEE